MTKKRKVKPKLKRRKLPPRPRRVEIEKEEVIIPVSSFHRNSCVGAYLDYKQGAQIGKGCAGTVYELCDEKKHCPYVLKVREISGRNEWRVRAFYSEFQREVDSQKRAYGLAPTIYDAWTCVNYTVPRVSTFIVMERMDGDLEHYLRDHVLSDTNIVHIVDQIRILIQELRLRGLCHGDLQNPGNVLYKGNRWYLGDFGSSSILSRFCDDEQVLGRYSDIIRAHSGFLKCKR